MHQDVEKEWDEDQARKLRHELPGEHLVTLGMDPVAAEKVNEYFRIVGEAIERVEQQFEGWLLEIGAAVRPVVDLFFEFDEMCEQAEFEEDLGYGDEAQWEVFI